ncbi:MAG: 50S ribosomal protein L21 [Candidatus Zixiibacteriota bacterium]
MYAVFQLGGHQFSVEEGAVIRVPHQQIDKGGQLNIEQVLLLKEKDNTVVGSPYVDGARIEAEVLDHGKEDKIEVYKYKRRTKYRRRQGHRRSFSEIKINKIVAPEH